MKAHLWLLPEETAARITAAKSLGITLVDQWRDGKFVVLVFHVPDGVSFIH